jgi:hypothetical protein
MMKPVPTAFLTGEDLRVFEMVHQRTASPLYLVRDWNRQDAKMMFHREEAKLDCPFSYRYERREWFPSLWGFESHEIDLRNPSTPT